METSIILLTIMALIALSFYLSIKGAEEVDPNDETFLK